MSKVFKPRRGSADQVAAFIGEANEVILNTTTNTLHVMDGLTAGGCPLAKEADLNASKTAQSTRDAEQDAAIAGKLDKSGGEASGEIVGLRGFTARLPNSKAEPASGSSRNFGFQDKDGANIGYVRLGINSDGTVDIALHINPNGSKDGKWKSIILHDDGRITKNDKTLIPVPTGTIIDFAGNGTPGSGYLLCNGAAVSRTTYADLFAAIGTTYGAGNGSTTFNLPNFDGRFAQGSTTAGTVMEAGLPDHNHKFTHTQSNYYTKFGSSAFFTTEFQADGTSPSHYRDEAVNSLGKASAVNNIYGKSSTVQPPALTVRKFIRY